MLNPIPSNTIAAFATLPRNPSASPAAATPSPSTNHSAMLPRTTSTSSITSTAKTSIADEISAIIDSLPDSTTSKVAFGFVCCQRSTESICEQPATKTTTATANAATTGKQPPSRYNRKSTINGLVQIELRTKKPNTRNSVTDVCRVFCVVSLCQTELWRTLTIQPSKNPPK